MTMTDLVTDEAEPEGPCPACGRESERAVWERQMSRLRARTKLQTELLRAGCNVSEIAQAVTGLKTVAETYAARDARVAASQEGQNA
jgi:hypothetical protein